MKLDEACSLGLVCWASVEHQDNETRTDEMLLKVAAKRVPNAPLTMVSIRHPNSICASFGDYVRAVLMVPNG